MTQTHRDNPMLTPWGEQLNGAVAWQDYPRPQRVRSRWLNLNGQWDYAINPRTAPMPGVWAGQINVPFALESTLSGVGQRLNADQRLWYRRALEVPAQWSGDRLLLHFGAVDYEASVWIDGALVGTHEGGFDPFSFDITDYLSSSAAELVVGVWDPTSRGDQPRGKQHHNPQGIWYTPVSGIWQTVWLEPLPKDQHIAELRCSPDFESGAVDIEVLLERPSRRRDRAIRLKIWDGEALVAEQLVAPDRRTRLTLSQPRAWSPEDPFLYTVAAELVPITDPLPQDNDEQRLASLHRHIPLRGAEEAGFYQRATIIGDPADAVLGYFGLRSIIQGKDSQGRPTLLLNGERVFQLGTLDQGWWPDGLHTPPSSDAIAFELQYLKDAGFNTLRKHIKVEPAVYYALCDRLGLMVWQDMPTAMLPAQFVAPNDAAESLRTAASATQYELELRRMIDALRVHPSIVVWVIHNEGWGQYDTARLARAVEDLDSDRLVNSASGWQDVEAGSFLDVHDYEPSPSAPAAHAERALVLGEYGGVGWPIAGHLWDSLQRNWGYQTYHDLDSVQQAYREKTAAVFATVQKQGVSAAIYTQTSDVESEVNGLLTYDRRVEKLDRAWLRAVHEPLRQLLE